MIELFILAGLVAPISGGTDDTTDVAVVGIRHDVLGQEVKAFVVVREPVSADDLRAFVATRLAKFQVPTLWEFRDALPKPPTQRVEKYKLRGEAPGSTRPLLG